MPCARCLRPPFLSLPLDGKPWWPRPGFRLERGSEGIALLWMRCRDEFSESTWSLGPVGLAAAQAAVLKACRVPRRVVTRYASEVKESGCATPASRGHPKDAYQAKPRTDSLVEELQLPVELCKSEPQPPAQTPCAHFKGEIMKGEKV